MPTPRRDVVRHYLRTQTAKLSAQDLQEAIELADDIYRFRGTEKALSAVVRCDLNKYSEWCREKQPEERIPLLDDFFTRTLLTAQRFGGAYFRDEGDCVVLLFSDYFGTSDSLSRVRAFSRAVSREKYGTDLLTAKSTVSAGELVYYQKSHEVVNGEWSADGDPFIVAARVESEADSKQIVHFTKEDFDEYFSTSTSEDSADWVTEEQSARIPGLWKQGGHQKLVKDIYRPSAGDSGDSNSDFRAVLSDTKSPDPFEKHGGGRYASEST